MAIKYTSNIQTSNFFTIVIKLLFVESFLGVFGLLDDQSDY